MNIGLVEHVGHEVIARGISSCIVGIIGGGMNGICGIIIILRLLLSMIVMMMMMKDCRLGSADGPNEGRTVGILLGEIDDMLLGDNDGIDESELVGEFLGSFCIWL